MSRSFGWGAVRSVPHRWLASCAAGGYIPGAHWGGTGADVQRGSGTRLAEECPTVSLAPRASRQRDARGRESGTFMSSFRLRSWPFVAFRARRWNCVGADAAAQARAPLRNRRRILRAHRGAAESQGRASCPVPAGHLDDALKTLVVLGDGGKARVQGVEFASSVSRRHGARSGRTAERRRKPGQHADLLRSLKGRRSR